MKRKIYISIIAVFVSLGINAQVLNNDMIRAMDEFNELKRIFPKDNSGYNGSPYLNDSFVPGFIEMKDGKRYKNILLRYNIHNDQVEFESEGETMAIDNPDRIARVRIDKQEFYYFSFYENKELKKGYLEMLRDGKYALYLRHRVILKAGSDAGAYQEATQPTFHLQKPAHFIARKDSNPVKVKSTDDILSAYKDLEEPLKKYAGKKNLKLKKEEDYINLIDYLNKGQ
ncbi:MAG: hypothetical protein QNK33_04210 [Bacteroidales bacterium]|nr:hypothetical protein [Bacteroidales bacterium]